MLCRIRWECGGRQWCCRCPESPPAKVEHALLDRERRRARLATDPIAFAFNSKARTRSPEHRRRAGSTAGWCWCCSLRRPLLLSVLLQLQFSPPPPPPPPPTSDARHNSCISSGIRIILNPHTPGFLTHSLYCPFFYISGPPACKLQKNTHSRTSST